MHRLRLLACAVTGAVLSVFVAAPAALAHPNPPPEPLHAGHESQHNFYVAKGGHADIRFSDMLRDKLDKAKAHIRYIEPWINLPGEPADAGLRMPVGSRYDAIQPDTRITYPGGFVISVPHKGTFSVNGASLKLIPGIAGFYFAPWVGEHQVGKDVRLVSMSLVEAFTIAGALMPHPEEGIGTWGPTDLALRVTPEFREAVAPLGVDLPVGESAATITVRWSDRTEWKNRKKS